MLKIKFKKKVSLEEAFGGELSQKKTDAVTKARNLINNGNFKELADLINTVSLGKEEEGYKENYKSLFYDYIEKHLGSVTGTDFKLPDAVRDPNKNAEINLYNSGHLSGLNHLDNEGKYNGKSYTYYKDGKLWIESNYLNNGLHGEYTMFDKEGRVDQKMTWKDGKKHGVEEYFNDGSRTLVFYKIDGNEVTQERFEQYCRDNPNDPVCKPTETPSEL